MDAEVKQKMETYVRSAFKAAHTENHRAAEHEIKATGNKLTAKGRAGANVLYDLVPIRAKEIRQDVMALASNTMDAYLLYEVLLEEAFLRKCALSTTTP